MLLKYIKSSHGITILEILLSIAILGIVLVTIMALFPQMGVMNKQNETKVQAVNTAKNVLIKWQNSEEVLKFLENPEIHEIDSYVKEDNINYYFKQENDDFIADIKIKKTSDVVSKPSEARGIHIQIQNDNGAVMSETYGYILLD
ncbi:type IV pilus modification PilV family protein [Cytobacillus firmus]|uniref:type IV pilus modification PilV family protein n=1 Tax=Cytobacillus firmus TaxID=1399 RepID=UPI0030015791